MRGNESGDQINEYVSSVRVSVQVNNSDVSGMSHTEVVNLVRASPRVVDLVVGRILESPKPPIEAHLLPDITFQCPTESLGKNFHQVPLLCISTDTLFILYINHKYKILTNQKPGFSSSVIPSMVLAISASSII